MYVAFSGILFIYFELKKLSLTLFDFHLFHEVHSMHILLLLVCCYTLGGFRCRRDFSARSKRPYTCFMNLHMG